ncbi:MAG: hypothetical protein GF375_06550 [Candidatus Omnitrophica bacterium]|nr:hypothetical protein [Candidatus Omnitrophota bacterium]MBD3269634.1 hypothetical protein [Candidatus Omnitrophota bacterium]
MRVDVSFKYLEQSDFISNILENNLKKIERRLKIFRKKGDPVHLSLHIEKNPHKEQYFCRSCLYLPSNKVLVADEKGRKASIAINKAFSALSRQLVKVKYKMEKHLQKRKV